MSRDQIIEREYYFDEALGTSLNDHIADVKKQFPSVNVQVRRDKDNFPIIRLQIKPHFKYDMETFFKIDPNNLKKVQYEN